MKKALDTRAHTHTWPRFSTEGRPWPVDPVDCRSGDLVVPVPL